MDEFDGLGIADHIAVKAVFAAQKVREEPAGRGDRLAVPVVVAAHHAHWTGSANYPCEREEEYLVKLARSDVRIGAAVAVAAALRDRIHRIVLQRRGDALRLDARGHFRAQLAYKIRILAVAFKNAPPARIARDIENRRIDVRVANQLRLHADDFTRLPDKRAIPR